MYDAIIVGLGPAGSTAMESLAAAGWRVLGLDQADFPRPKVCAGCLSLKLDKVLAPGFHSVVERTVRGMTLSYRGERSFHFRAARPLGYMTMRERFDAYLLEAALRRGGEARTGERVLRVREAADAIVVTTRGHDYEGRFLIAADGAASTVARQLGRRRERQVALALESEVAVGKPRLGALGDEVRIEFGTIPFGCAWVFPKADHVSVGVGGLKGRIGSLKAYYTSYVSRERLAAASLLRNRGGWAIPLHPRRGAQFGTRRCLFTGDAAELVDPFIGEGIYYAVRSGQLAADSLLGATEDAAALVRYEAALRRELCPELAWARRVATFFYSFPKLAYRVLTENEAVRASALAVLRGDERYRAVWLEFRRQAGRALLQWMRPRRTRPARRLSFPGNGSGSHAWLGGYDDETAPQSANFQQSVPGRWVPPLGGNHLSGGVPLPPAAKVGVGGATHRGRRENGRAPAEQRQDLPFWQHSRYRHQDARR